MKYVTGMRVKPHKENIKAYMDYLDDNGMDSSASTLKKIACADILTISKKSSDRLWISDCPEVNGQFVASIDSKFHPWDSIPANLVTPLAPLKRGER